jgi:hypothetical protein
MAFGLFPVFCAAGLGLEVICILNILVHLLRPSIAGSPSAGLYASADHNCVSVLPFDVIPCGISFRDEFHRFALRGCVEPHCQIIPLHAIRRRECAS